MKKFLALAVLLSGAVLLAADQAKAQTPAAAPAATVAQPAVAAPAPAAAVVPAAQAAPAPAAAVAPAVQTAQPAVAAPAQQEKEPGVLFCLGRGLCNVCTGWLELPRCVIYDNGFLPVFGMIMGFPHGACMTVARELCGVFDLITFGTTGNLCHGKRFPHLVFQDNWVYERK